MSLYSLDDADPAAAAALQDDEIQKHTQSWSIGQEKRQNNIFSMTPDSSWSRTALKLEKLSSKYDPAEERSRIWTHPLRKEKFEDQPHEQPPPIIQVEEENVFNLWAT